MFSVAGNEEDKTRNGKMLLVNKGKMDHGVVDDSVGDRVVDESDNPHDVKLCSPN